MRVLPICPSVNNKKQSFLLQNNSQTNAIDYVPNNKNILFGYNIVSFSSSEFSKFAKEMQSLKGIHCPICGVKMLTSEELETVPNEIHSIASGENLINYIEKYKEYINPSYEVPLKSIAKIVRQNPEITANSALRELQKRLSLRTNSKISTLKEYIQEINKTSNNQQVKNSLIIALMKLNSIDTDIARHKYSKHIPALIKNTAQQFEGKDKYEFISNSLNLVEQPILDEMLVQSKDDQDIVSTFCLKILGQSKANLNIAIRGLECDNHNLINSCQYCTSTGKQLKHVIVENREPYYKYTYDIAKETLNGNLKDNEYYIVDLIDSIRKYFKHAKVFPDSTQLYLKSLYEYLDIKPQASNIVFPLVDKKGVSCAYCGQETATHVEKMEILNNIQKAENMNEIIDIINSNKKFIKPKYQILIDCIIKHKHSTIDDDKICASMKKQVGKKYISELMKSATTLSRIMNSHQLLREDREAIIQIKKELDAIMLQNSRKSQTFPLEEYREKLKTLTERFCDRYDIRDEIWNAAYMPFKDIYVLQRIMNPDAQLIPKVDSKLKIILQTIFKSSTATIEHLDPQRKYVSSKDKPNLYQNSLKDKSNNLVVACHECNYTKSGKELHTWVARNPDIINNFSAYLKRIKNSFNLVDIKYNIYEVARHFEKLTGRELPPIV